ncbi:hypothetical protein [Burkholderia cenocepacia]|uniref:hypothetical protein n=1 Tax=Burkholderia cenocepacia TaxID=95486 RepID=UPI002AB6D916|nr:hypothetical protein [Burkholderia cenocepacia]
MEAIPLGQIEQLCVPTVLVVNRLSRSWEHPKIDAIDSEDNHRSPSEGQTPTYCFV